MSRLPALALLGASVVATAGAQQPRSEAPAATPETLEQSATGFTCIETITVEVEQGGQIDRVPAGRYDYLLRAPRKAGHAPYFFREHRAPGPGRDPWRLLEQPVPLSWLTLQQEDSGNFRHAGACDAGEAASCREFVGTLAFRDGRDPREWRGKVWRDEGGDIVRVEAVPVHQGERRERWVGRPATPGAGADLGLPRGSVELPTIRLDGTVEEIRCEIEFSELLPGRRLPARSACHRESVKRGGKVKKRWTLLREFSACKRFGVDTREDTKKGRPEGRPSNDRVNPRPTSSRRGNRHGRDRRHHRLGARAPR